MPIPDFQTLMLPALELGATRVIKLKDSITALSDQFDLSEAEREELLPSGNMTTIRNRVAWAVSYLVQAKLLYRPHRGVFTITDRGKSVLDEKPEIINMKYLERFPEYLEFKHRKKDKKDTITPPGGEETLATPEERIGSAYEEITEDIKSELLAKTMDSSPEFFETLIVSLLIAMGYGGSSSEAGKHLGKSGDGGIDGIINEDELGLDIIYIQAKRYAPDNTIGRPEIQKFAGSLIGMGANKGVFVTTSFFSSKASEYAKNIPQRIILIDGDKLTSLMLSHNVGVRLHQAIELKKIDEDFFLE